MKAQSQKFLFVLLHVLNRQNVKKFCHHDNNEHGYSGGDCYYLPFEKEKKKLRWLAPCLRLCLCLALVWLKLLFTLPTRFPAMVESIIQFCVYKLPMDVQKYGQSECKTGTEGVICILSRSLLSPRWLLLPRVAEHKLLWWLCDSCHF